MKPPIDPPPAAARSPGEAAALRREDGEGHPIERRDYLLTTPAIKALFDHVCEWVDFAIPGAIIAGRPRLGKTRAIEALTVLLEWQYPGLPVHWIFCEDHEQTTERTFFEDALRDTGHSYVKQGTARDKRNRLIEALLQSARERDQRRVVVFADEAQRLRERQYNWLVDVHNALDRRGVALIVFMVGQPELVDIRAAVPIAGFRSFQTHGRVGLLPALIARPRSRLGRRGWTVSWRRSVSLRWRPWGRRYGSTPKGAATPSAPLCWGPGRTRRCKGPYWPSGRIATPAASGRLCPSSAAPAGAATGARPFGRLNSGRFTLTSPTRSGGARLVVDAPAPWRRPSIGGVGFGKRPAAGADAGPAGGPFA
ncbi:MAG: ATP-binding protein [Verrucomicrobia bacterium]|nr:ATP-binding protein [Verrucomicrobiota bacterium]